MSGNGTQPFAAERNSMVESQLRHRGIRDERLLAAMSKVPRHEFVNEQNWNEAYADHPIPIAEQQTTSQPYMIAAMIQAAQIKPEDRVLEIGAGSGYQTALLAELASQVFAVERYASLAEAAQKTLGRLGYRNAKIVTGPANPGTPVMRLRNALQAFNSSPFECGKSVQSDYMEIARPVPLSRELPSHLHVIGN